MHTIYISNPLCHWSYKLNIIPLWLIIITTCYTCYNHLLSIWLQIYMCTIFCLIYNFLTSQTAFLCFSLYHPISEQVLQTFVMCDYCIKSIISINYINYINFRYTKCGLLLPPLMFLTISTSTVNGNSTSMLPFQTTRIWFHKAIQIQLVYMISTTFRFLTPFPHPSNYQQYVRWFPGITISSLLNLHFSILLESNNPLRFWSFAFYQFCCILYILSFKIGFTFASSL